MKRSATFFFMQTPPLDAERYPRLAAYLATVPAGIASYPDAQTRAFYSIELRKRLGPRLTEAALPTGLKQVLSTAWRPDDWISATIYVALSALARDCLWLDDRAYHRGMFDIAAIMYGSLVFRAVMYILSPSLMVMGAAKRWGSFHKNTSLSVTAQSKSSATFLLTYPSHLFDENCLKSLGATFDCAISGAGARGFAYKLEEVTDTSASFLMDWGP